MSIPPLVCSTPPPPEQCEDDKDHEDFDLSYNLSQEDDDGYDYGNFSSYNHFDSTMSKNINEIYETQNFQSENIDNAVTESNAITPEIKNHELSIEDDVIEDLNLNIQKNCPDVVENSTNEDKSSIEDLKTDIPSDFIIIQNELEAINNENEDSIKSDLGLGVKLKINCNEDSNTRSNGDGGVNMEDEVIVPNTSDNLPNTSINIEDQTNEKVLYESENVADPNSFEDFDDFQFISSDDKPETVLTLTDNPWDNDIVQSDGFGEFTANFADDDTKSNITSSQVQMSSLENIDNEDDFGDFDEFKSVSELNNAPDQEDLSILNLQSSDSESQINERINKVIHTIFEQEIAEPSSILESKLDGLLGLTWGHLKETDTRQPYIVNWNNSLVQKTLLKALCIDSRNILFGPKWSSNMPKYAANLGTAPLQPQKQNGLSLATPRNEVSNPEIQSASKTSWNDPFSSDGQEFTYAEALLLDLEHLMATLDQMAHNHSSLKISELLSHACNTEGEGSAIETGPTDIGVFEGAVSTKTDKIYSNAMEIQPMRQINLPDTHIFTPTNSEIPRSKTIHYDNTSHHDPSATIVVPQSVPDIKTVPQADSLDNNEYWEFQDFRGKASNSATNEEPTEITNNGLKRDSTINSNFTIATQVLQPIKLEPIMPTLNWPAPGEVKETFDDFADFMSNCSNIEGSEAITEHGDTVFVVNDLDKRSESLFDESKSTSIKPDDDFEMFQSALPSVKNPLVAEDMFKNQALQIEASPKQINFNPSFSKDIKDKSENISFGIPKSIQQNSLENISNLNDSLKPQQQPPIAPQMANINMLQPTPANVISRQSHQKTGQILHPLSLESFSQINWPSPGIDLQDLSRFNPVESLQTFKNDSNSHSKTSSPVHNHKSVLNNNQTPDEDIWGEFVSIKPKQQTLPKKQSTFTDDDEWTEFKSSPNVIPHNGLNTISFNVHTNSGIQKSSNSTKFSVKSKSNEIPLDIPTLSYITPKTSGSKPYDERQFQNL